MLRDLNSEKEKLNNLCSELNELYEQLIIDEDPNAIFGQHLKRDVEQLAVDIPNIKKNIELYETAQAKLYKAREYIESAMKSLPGASTFLDRQAIVANYNNKSNLFGNKRPLCMMDSIHSSDEIASRSCELVAEASLICPDVPLIPMSVTPKMDVVSILTHYRGYRLKIESVLRTRLNPRLHGYKNQFASAKYHYEQRVIEWVDHQIITLEAYLRSNGCLLNDDLNREISMLRMGSRAAIAAVASETSERVTVDDVLEISLAEGSALPEYALIEPNNSSSSSSDSSTSSHLDESDPIHPSSVNACVNNSTNIVHHDLPSYTIHEHPPAYSA
ncbi:hypothetical protein G6F22_012511 [Rhizopus arrhizus]|nr:hypothetical protein G6F23_006226 [Rhizopus arrhizus]KAG0776520.1 hypothetical protein G6F22_012511 [Rhizopus arrhizus]KAG1413154.1 hypothetical protein G6F58_007646 [Rhizopus delemar]